MKVGLLWFDSDPKRSLEEKIATAAQRYQVKFGTLPNTCYVNPDTVTEKRLNIGDLEVLAADNVLPNHFLLGVSESF